MPTPPHPTLLQNQQSTIKTTFQNHLQSKRIIPGMTLAVQHTPTWYDNRVRGRLTFDTSFPTRFANTFRRFRHVLDINEAKLSSISVGQMETRPPFRQKTPRKTNHLGKEWHHTINSSTLLSLSSCPSPIMQLAEPLTQRSRVWHKQYLRLVAEYPTCSVLAMRGWEGLCPYD